MSEKTEKVNMTQKNTDWKIAQKTLEILEQYSWPIPHPSYMAQYETICPWSADRILTMAEGQWDHRKDIEKKVIDANIKESKIWQIFAFIMFMTLIVGWIILIILDKNWQWFLVTWAGILTAVLAYIYGKKSQKKESDT